jgi:hypothetical protein
MVVNFDPMEGNESMGNSLNSKSSRLCIFCGSSSGNRQSYTENACALGEVLVKRGYGMVYGGGRVGLMGILADAVLQNGGEVIGVIPKALAEKEVAHQSLTELHVVATMHERKALMAELSDGFVALPGGLGTFEELFEVFTWAQLGLHGKPLGLLNVDGYYDPLLALIDHATSEGFIRLEHRQLLLTSTWPEELLDMFAGYQPTTLPKWIERDQT